MSAAKKRYKKAYSPFFTFYGGKWRIAPKYPSPQHDMIIEPFAGSAGYSVRHASRNVILIDKDEKVIGTWRYLISVSEREIRNLPVDIQTVNDLDLPQEAKWLIGWWLNKGTTAPCKSPSRWMRDGIRPNSHWGPVIRERIASSLQGIRHWNASIGDYGTAPDVEATWFIDPPYQIAGGDYRYSSKDIDYEYLSGWSASRRGQVIACENAGATWLPFEPFIDAKATEGKKRSGVSREAIWYRASDLIGKRVKW